MLIDLRLLAQELNWETPVSSVMTRPRVDTVLLLQDTVSVLADDSRLDRGTRTGVGVGTL